MSDDRRVYSRSSEVEDAFAANYPAFQYTFIQFLSEHLADISREFGGDLQQVMILAVIGQSFLAALNGTTDRPPDRASGITASRLADVTGTPRETVRRKLKLLETRGWIRQEGEQGWTIVFSDDIANARKDLAALDERSMARIARMYVALERLAKQSAQPAVALEPSQEGAQNGQPLT